MNECKQGIRRIKIRTGSRMWEGRGKGIFLINQTGTGTGVCPAEEQGCVDRPPEVSLSKHGSSKLCDHFHRCFYDVLTKRTWVFSSYSSTHLIIRIENHKAQISMKLLPHCKKASLHSLLHQHLPFLCFFEAKISLYYSFHNYYLGNFYLRDMQVLWW